MGRVSNFLNSNNTLDLNCVGMDKSDISITWYPELHDARLIIKEGKEVGKIGYEYGLNEFKILLTNGVAFNVGHFKTNNWHAHQYEMEVKKDNKGYAVKFKANGVDFERTEKSYNDKGLPNGQIAGYFENGNLSFKEEFVNGKKQGQFIYYHRNGELRSTVDYIDDELHGYKKDYDEIGNIIRTKEFINGQQVATHE